MIIQTSVTVSISNMRRAISDCNVTVNTAVSPNLWLKPSDNKKEYRDITTFYIDLAVE